MSAFLGRGKGKFKRDKNANSDWTADYLDADKLKQKYTEKAKTTWNECEYLYAARVSRCSRRSASAGALVESDAVLALFHIPQSAGVSIACFECGQTVELGLHEPLEDIRKIENDGAPTDVSCTMADSEILWRMNSHTERDEFVWILCQLSKHMTGLSIPVLGYVPDIDLRAGGLEIKYPYLHKLLNAELASLVHVEDEREAELLLEQLDWTKPVPELQAHLHDDILLLNVEICDLLLQWEEDEDKSRPQHAASRVRDTVELLTTLNHVDKELGFVDDWLGNQINHLSEVQAEIKQIESESGTLETSLQNLTAVKSLISSLTQNLQLSRAHEDILINAEKNLKSLMVMYR